MRRAAELIVKERSGRFPERYEDILSLPGIGEYTAGAIASICFEQKTAAVDGNVLRVISRLLEDRSDMKSASVKKRIRAYLEGLYPDTHHRGGLARSALPESGFLRCTRPVSYTHLIENHGFRGVTNGNKKLASNAKRYPLCENRQIPFTRNPPCLLYTSRCV